MKFLLEDLFLENVKETVIKYEKKNMEKIEKFVGNDTFNVVSGQGLGKLVICLSGRINICN